MYKMKNRGFPPNTLHRLSLVPHATQGETDLDTACHFFHNISEAK